MNENKDDDNSSKTCPFDGCENKRNLNNKKGRCNDCQKFWYETKWTFFGRGVRCIKCQKIFEPETNGVKKKKDCCQDCC